ncbi:transporter [Marinobacterium nitratireducens]|uniref:Transporter n=1 Tax=Marinobacterium nitratireducens TaxID=518897 RepID=A0A918DR76_9GAMM|nr:sodium-dependent transporter [Marinobacterium nitratireducens]GGO78495.1 transporter [Marinobacterium nitratireducens]
MQERQSIHGTWASRWVFILAATGSAVGLGNIWKFPYITGEHGGGAFVLVYLVCILLVGIPIMMGEVLVGRRGRCSPINSVKETALESGLSSRWQLLGWMGALAGFMIFTFYSVIAGWVLHYIAGMANGDYTDIGRDQAGSHFEALLAAPQTMLIYHSIFVVLVMLVVVGGVNKGLERATRIMMPALFVLLLLLLGYSFTTGSFGEGLSFLFSFSLEALTWDSVLVALGHSFFTLSLGMGAILAYGAYMPKNASIGGTVLTIGILDTVVALVAGMAIFPIVFANDMDPGAGPGLIFITLPVAFGQMPGGQIFGFLFFLLVGVAAWTSAISLMEPATAWLVERFGLERLPACLLLGFAGWAVGIACLGSFNFLSDFTLLGMNTFDFLDFVTANIMLPLGGLLLAIYVGWFLKTRVVESELAIAKQLHFRLWYLVLRLVSPVAVAIIFALNLYQKLA